MLKVDVTVYSQQTLKLCIILKVSSLSFSLSQDEGGEPIDCSTGTSGKRVNVYVSQSTPGDLRLA